MVTIIDRFHKGCGSFDPHPPISGRVRADDARIIISGAERMRRSKERCRQGEAIATIKVERATWAHVTPFTGSQGQICFTCGLQGTTVDTLISLGWPQADSAGDVDAIARAFRRFAGRALDLARRGVLDLWSIWRRVNLRPRCSGDSPRGDA